MGKKVALGFEEALQLMYRHVKPLPEEKLDLAAAQDRILAEDVTALVDSPSIDASLKDGYAVVSRDIDSASLDCPVFLSSMTRSVVAGKNSEVRVESGHAVRILSGAQIPDGADAVLAEEFVGQEDNRLRVVADAKPGRNIMPRGCDVAAGQPVAAKGDILTPGRLGLLAASGHSNIQVMRRPKVCIIATGDEVVAPGKALPKGKLYASNLVTLAAWCRRFGFTTSLAVVPDDLDKIRYALLAGLGDADTVITSGGAWTGDRDLVAKILDQLGWTKIFHRIRIGPGKAVGFGLYSEKPVFLLPGGPPSNLIAFLQVALPGILRLAGYKKPGIAERPVKIEREYVTPFVDWTQFFFGELVTLPGENHPLFLPLNKRSRLRSMAEAMAIIKIPEGVSRLEKNTIQIAQCLDFA